MKKIWKGMLAAAVCATVAYLSLTGAPDTNGTAYQPNPMKVNPHQSDPPKSMHFANSRP